MTDSLYDSEFFRKRTTKMRNWEMKLGYDIAKRYAITSLVDFGCGVGSFLEGALQAGTKHVRGYELNYDIAKAYLPDSVARYISYGDVGTRIDCPMSDCSMSVEVAEHIDPSQSDEFVRNLTFSASRMIFVTAAPPGQNGIGHINCQKQDFWIKKFLFYDWVIAVEETVNTSKAWHKILNNIFPKRNGPNYVADNLMIFKKHAAVH